MSKILFNFFKNFFLINFKNLSYFSFRFSYGEITFNFSEVEMKKSLVLGALALADAKSWKKKPWSKKPKEKVFNTRFLIRNDRFFQIQAFNSKTVFKIKNILS